MEVQEGDRIGQKDKKEVFEEKKQLKTFVVLGILLNPEAKM